MPPSYREEWDARVRVRETPEALANGPTTAMGGWAEYSDRAALTGMKKVQNLKREIPHSVCIYARKCRITRYSVGNSANWGQNLVTKSL